MIFEFALEPELVASWVDRAAYRFFDGKFGIGQRRIASAFPAKDKWSEMVLTAFQQAFSSAQPTVKQAASKNLEALLVHLRKDMVERRSTATNTWREAVIREHVVRKFQGILALASPRPLPPLLCGEDLEESAAEWCPPTPPTPRRVVDMVRALEPVLRFCREARFVDPYLDASLPDFREPLTALLKAAQQRPDPTSVTLELHTSCQRKPLPGRSPKHEDIAREIAEDCRKWFAPILARGTSLRVFVWSENVVRAEKLHNRYILTNVGGVSVPTGLDRAHPSADHTDDLTLLSREQHDIRWRQYREGSPRLRCVLGPVVVTSTAS